MTLRKSILAILLFSSIGAPLAAASLARKARTCDCIHLYKCASAKPKGTMREAVYAHDEAQESVRVMREKFPHAKLKSGNTCSFKKDCCIKLDKERRFTTACFTVFSSIVGYCAMQLHSDPVNTFLACATATWMFHSWDNKERRAMASYLEQRTAHMNDAVKTFAEKQIAREEYCPSNNTRKKTQRLEADIEAEDFESFLATSSTLSDEELFTVFIHLFEKKNVVRMEMFLNDPNITLRLAERFTEEELCGLYETLEDIGMKLPCPCQEIKSSGE